MVIEVLANILSKESSITGIKVAQIDCKLALYADDIGLFFLMNSQGSIMRLQDLLNLYGRVLGYKINQGKSYLMGVNIPEQMRSQVCKVRWDKEGL